MVSVFEASKVDRALGPRSGQTKDKAEGFCCFTAKHATLRGKTNGITIMFLFGATCLSVDHCFSKLVL